MTKLEEVARAILRVELEREAANLLAVGKAADSLSLSLATVSGVERHWRKRVEEARAALEALRVPNEEMIEGGEALTLWSGTGSGCYCDHHAEPARVFPAMIDAILKEKP